MFSACMLVIWGLPLFIMFMFLRGNHYALTSALLVTGDLKNLLNKFT